MERLCEQSPGGQLDLKDMKKDKKEHKKDIASNWKLSENRSTVLFAAALIFWTIGSQVFVLWMIGREMALPNDEN